MTISQNVGMADMIALGARKKVLLVITYEIDSHNAIMVITIMASHDKITYLNHNGYKFKFITLQNYFPLSTATGYAQIP